MQYILQKKLSLLQEGNIRAALGHHYDVMRLPDVISHVTIRLSIDDLRFAINRNKTRIWLNYHDVITDVMMHSSTIHVDPIDTQQEIIVLKDRLILTKTRAD